jgi:LPXTG-site transpeptidase (sortase) family protein
MQETEDILAAFDIESSIGKDEKQPITITDVEKIRAPIKKSHGTLQKTRNSAIFLVKYFTTSACIFWILMLATNYSAYWNLASSIIYAEEMEITKKSLIQSVAAASVSDDESENTLEQDTFKQLSESKSEKYKYTPSMHSIAGLMSGTSKGEIDLWIEITPYENRIIIPAIGKNIPLIDIKQQKVEGVNELNDIFMKELENGVIRYPGSAKPGEQGNSFIFGHSSNFPWMEWEYNDIFSLLDHVSYDDEVIVYYGQEKHTYKIRTKNVISPGDVSVLQDDPDDKSKLTLMTCWPIGTTLNRLILTGDLISVE